MLSLAVIAVIIGIALVLMAAVGNKWQGPNQNTSEWRLIRTILGIASIALIMLACISAVVLSSAINREPAPIPFSIEGWNSSKYDSDGSFSYVRYKMVRDLLKRYDFHGWSITEVEKLLNMPDDEKDENQKHLIYYDLGSGIDFLILQVDTNRQVVDYYLQLD